jgi:hypothetical protein
MPTSGNNVKKRRMILAPIKVQFYVTLQDLGVRLYRLQPCRTKAYRRWLKMEHGLDMKAVFATMFDLAHYDMMETGCPIPNSIDNSAKQRGIVDSTT